MKRNILYYPTIDIPQNNWLRHALLYWDEVSSIIPENLENSVSPHIEYLISEGEFRSIRPESFFQNLEYHQLWDDFGEELNEIICSPQFEAKLKLYYHGEYDIHQDKMGIGMGYNIHLSKILSMSLYQLEIRKLVRFNRDNKEWITFEKNTALVYMSLLAKYLADTDKEQTIIGTDFPEYENLTFKKVKSENGFATLSLSFNNLLPTPTDNISFEKILDFKRKRHDNLLKFRLELFEFQKKLSNVESLSELKDNIITFREQLELEVKELNSIMKDSRIQVIYNSIKSLIDVKSPSMLIKVGSMYALPVDLAALGIGVMSLIDVAGNYIEHRNKTRASLRDSSFSYIYQAQKDGIIQSFK